MAFFQTKQTDQAGAADTATFGPYRLHELINSGWMADLWLATNQKEEAVALRIMHERLRFNFLARNRFLRGCEILSKIHNHEQVINYYGHGKINGRLYMLMEYVEGANMREMFNRNDQVLIDQVWNILLDMALALEHVHDSGFMHLDYKPENLVITRNGQVRLIDFDLSRPRPDKPIKPWKYAGTPAYMAPEQLMHKPFDHRVDIFAYGVVAYELLTRHRPFVGDTTTDIVRKQTNYNQSFIAPREHNPDLSVAMEKLIMRCLERDPDKRYSDMSILIHDLKTAP